METPSPTYEEVMNACQEISRNHSPFVSYEELGFSAKNRAIPLLIITDPSFSLNNKKVILLTGGVDGNEEVGRAVSLGFARWLLQSKNSH